MKKLLSLMLAAGLVLVGCSGGEEQQPKDEPIKIEMPETEEDDVVVVEEEEEVEQIVAMNEPIIIKYFGEDAVQIKILEVRFTNDRNEFYDGVPVENIVFIKAEIENISDEEQSIWGSDIFNVYDMDGNKLDTYPSTDYEYEDYAVLNPGRKAIIEECFGIPSGTAFELEVVEDTWEGGAIGSLFFEGEEVVQQEEQPVQEPKQEEPIVKEEPEQEVAQEDLFVLIQDDEEAKVWRFNGSYEEFLVLLVKESELAESNPDLSLEEQPITTLVMVAIMASQGTTEECTLLTEDGEVLFTFKDGEQVAGLLQ